MKKTFLLLPALALGAVAASGQVTVIYSQPFDNPGGDANLEASPWNWSWARNGGSGRPSNSNIARVASAEFGFSFQNNANLQEIISWYDGEEVENIAQSSNLQFSIDLRHQNAASETRFVIRIGDDWYATTETFTNTGDVGDWTSHTWDFTNAGSAWVQIMDRTTSTDGFDGVSVTSNGFTILGAGDPGGLADPLPAGAITAVGVLNRSGSTTADQQIRYDNFAVAIPEPSTYAALIGLLALGLVAWRRRR